LLGRSNTPRLCRAVSWSKAVTTPSARSPAQARRS
jgi:hypothetical protein